MATFSIRLLGGLTVEVEGDDISSNFSGRLRVLLALLLLKTDVPQSRQSVAYTLWPESTDKQARTNLRKLILLFRSALSPNAHYFVNTEQTLCWRSDPSCWLDIDHFRRSLAAANKSRGSQAIALLSEVVDLYRGDLLPDAYDEWILAAREPLRDQYIQSLEQLCGLLEAQGRYAEGIAMARRLLQHDPVYERGHLHLMRLQAQMNDRAGALQSYHRCVILLRRELGVDPSPAIESLYLQLLDHGEATPLLSQTDHTPTIPLLGRHEAWQKLLHRWQTVQSGHAHFALIFGEAGIGKSRLAEELMGWVERQGNVVAYSRAYASDNRNLTYAPIASLLRVPVIRGEVIRLQTTWLTEIARLLPELLLERDDVHPPQPMLDDWQRHHLFAALTQALRPKRRPCLLIIDDLQWCDGETLTWLPHLLEHAHDERLFVVCTVRSEEFDDYTALQTLCETLRRRGQFDEIVLEPLDAPEIAELAKHVVGRALAPPHAQWLVGATEGNPLFVIETARLLHDENVADHLLSTDSYTADKGHSFNILSKLPQSVLAVIEVRLARLSTGARALAEVAATIGRSFTMPVLAAASALDEDQLVDALDELWRRRIIREGEMDAYDFSHDRIRDGAYRGISNLRKRFLHKRVAAAIMQTHRGALDEVSGQLGYHFQQANERASAIEQYMRAAAVAAGQYAHAETHYYIDRVMALTLDSEIALRFEALLLRDRVLEVNGIIADWEENTARLRQLAESEATNEAGKAGSMETLRRRALAAQRSSQSAPRLHDSALATAYAQQAVAYAAMTNDLSLQAICHYTIAKRFWFVAEFDNTITHLDRAINLARQVDDSRTLANALEMRAQTHMFNGGKASTIEGLMEESLIHYDKSGHLMGRAQILNKLGYLQFAQGTGTYEGARTVLLESIALSRRMESLDTEVSPQRNLAIVYTCMGNYAAADECLLRAQSIVTSLGYQGEDATLLNYRGFLYLNQGRLADAMATQQKALEGLTAGSHQQWRVKALTALAWILMRLGRPAEAAIYAALALETCRTINEQRQTAYTLIVRGILHTEGGELSAARSDFEEAHAILTSFEMFNRAQEAAAGLAYLFLLEGNTDAARSGTQAILEHLEAYPVDFTEDVCQLLLSCQRILNAIDPGMLPRLNALIDLHLSTRTATLNKATQELFWQIPAHKELHQALRQ